jgi:hypothetical protein
MPKRASSQRRAAHKRPPAADGGARGPKTARKTEARRGARGVWILLGPENAKSIIKPWFERPADGCRGFVQDPKTKRGKRSRKGLTGKQLRGGSGVA